MIIHMNYPSMGSFLDPLTTSDGQDYRAWKYHRIMEEAYFISKNMHTSVLDVDQLTPFEREAYVNFIQEEYRKTQEEIEKRKNQNK